VGWSAGWAAVIAKAVVRKLCICDCDVELRRRYIFILPDHGLAMHVAMRRFDGE
jgi:hypothetical protein